MGAWGFEPSVLEGQWKSTPTKTAKPSNPRGRGILLPNKETLILVQWELSRRSSQEDPPSDGVREQVGGRALAPRGVGGGLKVLA